MNNKFARIAIIFLGLFLTASFSLAAEQTQAGQYSSSQFDRPGICAGCHGIIYSQWDGAMHSVSEIDPFYMKEAQEASNDTDGFTDLFCARCHTPIGVMAGEVPPIDGSKLSEISKNGVQCDFCHTVSGSAGIGNAAFISTPGNIKWGPFSDSESPSHETAFSELHTKAEFCGMCHDVIHPVNGLQVEATYTEWKEGPYSKEGEQCQGCHMTPGITQFEANPGKAAAMGPKRDHIFTHNTVGGNAFITELLGSKTHANMAIERLKSAATLDIDFTADKNETVTMNVSITNSGAGHRLPTGLTEIREMWLEVIATDNAGKKIYQSGVIDNDGNIDNGAVIYKTVLADANGSPTTKFWLAEDVISDNRIFPRETVVEKHTFVIPEDAIYPVSVSTKLRYRSAPQDIIDHLFGEGVYEVPIIDMVEKSNLISTSNIISSAANQEPKQNIPGFGFFGVVVAFIFAYGKRRVN
ncbi:MAG: cytochrome c family protein [Methanosarcinaceae archaeon]|nr:cytochrome c family protein [Methanosarcinaceae archaeon]